MYKVNDVVVYRKSVCTVKDIKTKEGTKDKYYVLEPYYVKDGLTSKYQIPTENKKGFLRDLLTKDEVDELIKKMPKIKVLESTNGLLKNNYIDLIHNGNTEDLIRIVKTAYKRNKNRSDNNKKISLVDDQYLHEAEELLYQEFAIVLGITPEEAQEYIMEKIKVK